MKKVQKNWIDELSTRGVEEGLSIVRGQQDTIKVREFGGKGRRMGGSTNLTISCELLFFRFH